MTTPNVYLEALAAERAWDLFRQHDPFGLAVTRGPWEQQTTDAGILLSARLHGQDSARALLLWAACRRPNLSSDGPGQVPQMDLTAPGRVACVWQSGGVWLELWHPDTAVPKPSLLAARRALRPSARLPFTRRKTTKENTTA